MGLTNTVRCVALSRGADDGEERVEPAARLLDGIGVGLGSLGGLPHHASECEFLPTKKSAARDGQTPTPLHWTFTQNPETGSSRNEMSQRNSNRKVARSPGRPKAPIGENRGQLGVSAILALDSFRRRCESGPEIYRSARRRSARREKRRG